MGHIRLRFTWSGQRDSNPRSQPWQGRALPTKLCPRCILTDNVSAEARVTTIHEIFINASFVFFGVSFCVFLWNDQLFCNS